jgi:hypothetical protein
VGGQGRDVFGEAPGDVFGVPGVDLDQHPVAGGALDQGGHGAGAARADDQVALPVAGHGPVAGLGGRSETSTMPATAEPDPARRPCALRRTRPLTA